MQLLVGGLLLLLLVTVAATLLVQQRLADARGVLITVLRPAQVTAVAFSQDYVDLETAERGFLLTGDPQQLAPYQQGVTETATLRQRLNALLGDDPQSAMLLHEIDTAALAWRTQSTDPEIAGRRAGTLTTAALQAKVPTDDTLFGILRGNLNALQARANQLVANETQTANSAQNLVSQVSLGAAVLAVLLAGVAAWVLRQSLSKPLAGLIAQVRRVRGGDLNRAVIATGPAEIAEVAQAVDAMRVRIITESEQASTSQQLLARYEEAERIGRNLNETVVQRLFRTGLDLQSAASRQPGMSPVLASAVDNIDRAIRELQAGIFGLTVPPSQEGLSTRVLEVVSDSEPELGLAPRVHFGGRLDGRMRPQVEDEVVDALRGILGGLIEQGRHESVRIALDIAEGQLTLRVTDTAPAEPDGVVVPANNHAAARFGPLAELSTRAARLGGRCELRREAEEQIVDWVVPTGEATPA